ncbi:hypothetical protein ARMGADRAFT_935751 [Armillaria gallica]|uniref:Uncharacterized protein n=1 Tax=Armillaria gallica TaxID=47427 RepID=A0A2H3DMJ6_ARMGA|nr:hypothetical protein ARMGADRAFT_935751 [Armillaria gallica]
MPPSHKAKPPLFLLYHLALQTFQKVYIQSCMGFPVFLNPGTSAHSSYLFGVHDINRNFWDYSVKQVVLTLYSHTCHCVLPDLEKSVCDTCMALEKDLWLEGIVKCIKDGIHENTLLAYHSIGGLQEIHHRRQSMICLLHL